MKRMITKTAAVMLMACMVFTGTGCSGMSQIANMFTDPIETIAATGTTKAVQDTIDDGTLEETGIPETTSYDTESDTTASEKAVGSEYGETDWNNIHFSMQRTGDNTATLTVTSYTSDDTYKFGPWADSKSPVKLTGDDGTVSYAYIESSSFYFEYGTSNFVEGQTYTLDLTFNTAISGGWSSVRLNIATMSFPSEHLIDICF